MDIYIVLIFLVSGILKISLLVNALDVNLSLSGKAFKRYTYM